MKDWLAWLKTHAAICIALVYAKLQQVNQILWLRLTMNYTLWRKKKKHEKYS